MGRRSDLRARFIQEERQRVQNWPGGRTPEEVKLVRDGLAYADISGVDLDWLAPCDANLAVAPEWHRAGIVFKADDLQVYARLTEDGGTLVAIDIHPVAACGRCEAPTPLRAVDSRDAFVAELYAGLVAAGHVCSVR